MRVQTRVIETEAIHYTDFRETRDWLIAQRARFTASSDFYRSQRLATPPVILIFPGGDHVAPGDWIVVNPAGGLIVYTAETFNAMYEIPGDLTLEVDPVVVKGDWS